MPNESLRGAQRPSNRVARHLRRWSHRLAQAARRLAGMPDYAAHVAHLRARHRDQPVPTEREYYATFVARRYGDGQTRCC